MRASFIAPATRLITQSNRRRGSYGDQYIL